MVEKTNQSVWLAAALILVVLIAGLFIVSGNLNKAIEEKQTVNVPSAQEIADLIVIPEFPEFEAPVYEAPVFESDEQVSDLWKDLYSVEIAELELNAEENATTELQDLIDEAIDDSDGDFYDFLKANIEGFDELKSQTDDAEDAEIEVEVIELGLEEDEDKVAEVVFELEVKYTLESGVVQKYKDDVIATASVVYEEGDFGDEEVDLVFAF